MINRSYHVRLKPGARWKLATPYFQGSNYNELGISCRGRGVRSYVLLDGSGWWHLRPEL